MYTYVLNYFYMYIYMYLFSCVERERKLYLERHSMCITCISRDIDICTYFYVLRERENILYHYMCIYIHVLISMFLDRKCFWFDSKAYTLLLFILMKYYMLLYLIGFSNSICVITCTYVMYHSNSIYVLSWRYKWLLRMITWVMT